MGSICLIVQVLRNPSKAHGTRLAKMIPPTCAARWTKAFLLHARKTSCKNIIMAAFWTNQGKQALAGMWVNGRVVFNSVEGISDIMQTCALFRSLRYLWCWPASSQGVFKPSFPYPSPETARYGRFSSSPASAPCCTTRLPAIWPSPSPSSTPSRSWFTGRGRKGGTTPCASPLTSPRGSTTTGPTSLWAGWRSSAPSRRGPHPSTSSGALLQPVHAGTLPPRRRLCLRRDARAWGKVGCSVILCLGGVWRGAPITVPQAFTIWREGLFLAEARSWGYGKMICVLAHSRMYSVHCDHSWSVGALSSQYDMTPVGAGEFCSRSTTEFLFLDS